MENKSLLLFTTLWKWINLKENLFNLHLFLRKGFFHRSVKMPFSYEKIKFTILYFLLQVSGLEYHKSF